MLTIVLCTGLSRLANRLGSISPNKAHGNWELIPLACRSRLSVLGRLVKSNGFSFIGSYERLQVLRTKERGQSLAKLPALFLSHILSLVHFPQYTILSLPCKAFRLLPRRVQYLKPTLVALFDLVALLRLGELSLKMVRFVGGASQLHHTFNWGVGTPCHCLKTGQSRLIYIVSA